MVGVSMGVRPVRVDERGRITELSGEPFAMPGLEPAEVLRGLADAQAGRIRSLKAIREGRAGRRRPGGPTARESAPGVCNSTRLDWAPRSGVGLTDDIVDPIRTGTGGTTGASSSHRCRAVDAVEGAGRGWKHPIPGRL
jgi:hypothetical protein